MKIWFFNKNSLAVHSVNKSLFIECTARASRNISKKSPKWDFGHIVVF